MLECRLTGSLPAATAVLAMTFPVSLAAEVVHSEASGFTTKHTVTISRSRAEVYRTATGRIGSWWNDDHTVSGSAANLYLDDRPQGCFCERLGDSGGVVHMTVTFVNPTVMLRLSGGLGPLGLMGVSGNMTWEFADGGEGGTTVTWSYAVGGFYPGGLGQLAEPVDAVLTEQMTRLKDLLEAS